MLSKKVKLVKVTWNDTIAIAGWRDQEDLLDCWEFKPMTSYGLLLKKDKNIVILVGLISHDGDCNSIQLIPRGCILNIKEIEEV